MPCKQYSSLGERDIDLESFQKTLGQQMVNSMSVIGSPNDKSFPKWECPDVNILGPSAALWIQLRNPSLHKRRLCFFRTYRVCTPQRPRRGHWWYPSSLLGSMGAWQASGNQGPVSIGVPRTFRNFSWNLGRFVVRKHFGSQQRTTWTKNHKT